MKSEKKLLQVRLSAIEEQERIAREVKYRPIFEKKYVGKYFKYRNSYGTDKAWWLYTYITSINSVYPIHGNQISGIAGGWQFQKTSYEVVEIKKDQHIYLHSPSVKQEISQAEFYAAWNGLMRHIDSLPG